MRDDVFNEHISIRYTLCITKEFREKYVIEICVFVKFIWVKVVIVYMSLIDLKLNTIFKYTFVRLEIYASDFHTMDSLTIRDPQMFKYIRMSVFNLCVNDVITTELN